MKPTDYYGRTEERTEDWFETAFDPDYAPCKALVTAARPYLRTGRRVLDIGCQGGHHIALLRTDFESAIGLDIARYDSMWSRHPSIEFLEHDVDASPLPFPDGHFATILCMNVLEHVFDVFSLVREIVRTLEPRGTCLISVPNAAFVVHLFSLFRDRVPRTGASEYPFSESQGWDGQHLHYFTSTELSWLLGHAGLELRRRVSVGRWLGLKRLRPGLLDSSISVIAGRSSLEVV
jgi:SAM-dependent methyltransferase